MTRVLVCGGRDYKDEERVFRELDSIHATRRIDVLIQGGARGADLLAWEWGIIHRVTLETYTAEWKTHGKSAGIFRNLQMLKEGKPDLVLAFPGGAGTAHMVRIAKAAGKEVIEI